MHVLISSLATHHIANLFYGGTWTLFMVSEQVVLHRKKEEGGVLKTYWEYISITNWEKRYKKSCMYLLVVELDFANILRVSISYPEKEVGGSIPLRGKKVGGILHMLISSWTLQAYWEYQSYIKKKKMRGALHLLRASPALLNTMGTSCSTTKITSLPPIWAIGLGEARIHGPSAWRRADAKLTSAIL